MMLVSPAYRLIKTAIPDVREESSWLIPGWEAFLPFNIFGTVECNGWALCAACSIIPLTMMIFGLLPRITSSGGRAALFVVIACAMSLAPWFIDTYEIIGFGAALEATFDAKPQTYPIAPQNGLLWWNAAFISAAASVLIRTKPPQLLK